MNVLMSSSYHGVSVLANRARKYDPEVALFLMSRYNVRNTFLPLTALRLMITSTGYRDGLGEFEDCILKHLQCY